uniref:Uncharacterized protein n=1 Tax=Megaselia scalaris TaxID=36166 RepID=T1GHT5_MEGSC
MQNGYKQQNNKQLDLHHLKCILSHCQHDNILELLSSQSFGYHSINLNHHLTKGHIKSVSESERTNFSRRVLIRHTVVWKNHLLTKCRDKPDYESERTIFPPIVFEDRSSVPTSQTFMEWKISGLSAGIHN